MKITALAAALGALAMTVATPVAASAAAPSGFVGSWSAIDTDGSHLSLAISGRNGHLAVNEFDDAATVCGGAPARVVGAGTVDASTLFVPVTVACLPGGNVFRHRVVVTFTYVSGSDTLTDDAGVVWT